MMSHHIITGCATSTGCSVMRFMSWPGNRHLQTMLPVLCTLTASWVSITKAGGLSDTLGAARSPDGKDGDNVTHE